MLEMSKEEYEYVPESRVATFVCNKGLYFVVMRKHKVAMSSSWKQCEPITRLECSANY